MKIWSEVILSIEEMRYKEYGCIKERQNKQCWQYKSYNQSTRARKIIIIWWQHKTGL